MTTIQDFSDDYTLDITKHGFRFTLYIWNALQDVNLRRWCAVFYHEIQEDGYEIEIPNMCDDVNLVCYDILELKWPIRFDTVTDLTHDGAVDLIRTFADKYKEATMWNREK
jgi:hypothetical protein